MAKSQPSGGRRGDEPQIVNIARNRRASFEYQLLDTIECGIVLVGTEVKSLRNGHANLEEAYAKIDNDELFLLNAEIPEYTYGNRLNHQPKRDRKLLIKKAELAKFAAKAEQRGFTLVPVRMYFKDGLAKVEVAVARGKQEHDKRQSIKEKDAKREMDRAPQRGRRP